MPKMLRRGLTTAALVGGMMNPADAGDIRGGDVSKKTTTERGTTHGFTKRTNDIIVDIRRELGLLGPLKDMNDTHFEQALLKIKDNDLTRRYSEDDIRNLQTELDWTMGIEEPRFVNGRMDERTLRACVEFLKMFREKDITTKVIGSGQRMSYPYGFFKK